MTSIVYDTEIKLCIPDKYKKNNPKYKYCSGWEDFKNMGISIIGYCSLENPTDYGYFVNAYSFQSLINATLASGGKVYGFNSKGFDDKLLKANGINVTTDIDLLEQIRLSAFGSTNWKDTPSGHSYSLDFIARANNLTKTASGDLAPIMYQQGRMKELADYCINDCIITAKLINLFYSGKLKNPNTGRYFNTL